MEVGVPNGGTRCLFASPPIRRSTEPKHVGTVSRAHAMMDELFGEDVHAQRLGSLTDGVVGVVDAGQLSIHAIGRGLAAVHGLNDKHAVKQVDRLVGNEKIDVAGLQAVWTRWVLAGQTDVFVNLDWTEFDRDKHSMLVLSVQTPHGRSTPLMWKTVDTRHLKGRRNDHEDELLVRFRDAVGTTTTVTNVADRGFADQKLYTFLKDNLGFDFIIRFRSIVQVTDAQGETRPAKELVGPGGRMRVFRDASVTTDRTHVPIIALMQDKGIKDAWCLASSRSDLSGAELKKRYGRRFTCEETFRDIKDMRFGMGMDWKPVSTTSRRDRLMLLAVLALHLLTLLGAAGERAGLDRLLKTNTSAKRQLSLVRQGRRWYELLPTMPRERLGPLVEAYRELLRDDPITMALCA